jgi:hypothetical protein
MDAARPFEKLVPEYQTTECHILRPFGESCCLRLQHAMEIEAQGSSETLVPAEMTVTPILCATGTQRFQSLTACDFYKLLWLMQDICQVSLLPLWQEVVQDRTGFQARLHTADTNVKYTILPPTLDE